MILAFDTYYSGDIAKTIGLAFNDWNDETPVNIYTDTSNSIAAYEPGAFYKRELPCIHRILSAIDLDKIDIIIIDGYVILDDAGKLGLGGHLYESLDKKIPVIGVAKTSFAENTKNVRKVYRGKSANTLYITALGIDPDVAAKYIEMMKGPYSIPSLLKQLDMLTRQ